MDLDNQLQHVTVGDPCCLVIAIFMTIRVRRWRKRLPTLLEMDRNKRDSFCCGAGGAQMWKEEHGSEAVSVNRFDEAVRTGAERWRLAAHSVVMMRDA